MVQHPFCGLICPEKKNNPKYNKIIIVIQVELNYSNKMEKNIIMLGSNRKRQKNPSNWDKKGREIRIKAGFRVFLD